MKSPLKIKKADLVRFERTGTCLGGRWSIRAVDPVDRSAIQANRQVPWYQVFNLKCLTQVFNLKCLTNECSSIGNFEILVMRDEAHLIEDEGPQDGIALQGIHEFIQFLPILVK